MINKPIVQKIVLAGVVFNAEGKALILQRNSNEDIYPDLWELPSGKREPLEPSLDSLKREIMEEAGLDTEIVSAFSVFDYQIEKTTEIRDSTQINFIVKSSNFDVRLSEEHQNFAWITREDLTHYQVSDETRKVILKAFDVILKLT